MLGRLKTGQHPSPLTSQQYNIPPFRIFKSSCAVFPGPSTLSFGLCIHMRQMLQLPKQFHLGWVEAAELPSLVRQREASCGAPFCVFRRRGLIGRWRARRRLGTVQNVSVQIVRFWNISAAIARCVGGCALYKCDNAAFKIATICFDNR